MPLNWDDFQGVNRGYALDLYEQYRRDPKSVDDATRKLFEQLPAPPASDEGAGAPSQPRSAGAADDARLVGAFNLVQCIRRYGHLGAHIDPLGSEPVGDPQQRADISRVLYPVERKGESVI